MDALPVVDGRGGSAAEHEHLELLVAVAGLVGVGLEAAALGGGAGRVVGLGVVVADLHVQRPVLIALGAVGDEDPGPLVLALGHRSLLRD